MTLPSSRLAELVSRLPEIYQPIYGHPELSGQPSRPSHDRWEEIRRLHGALAEKLGRPVRVLDLGCSQGFFSLALAEAAKHERKVMPGGWKRAKHPAFAWVNITLGNLKGSLFGVRHWVSAKRLPRYVAEFQWRFNRRFGPASILQRLLHAAALTPPMPHTFLSFGGARVIIRTSD